jgi:hypothetical protein
MGFIQHAFLTEHAEKMMQMAIASSIISVIEIVLLLKYIASETMKRMEVYYISIRIEALRSILCIDILIQVQYNDLYYEYYIMVSVRATLLETFLTCPYKYKYEPTPSPDKLAFLFGTALHKLVEMHVQHLENQDAVDIILNRFGVKERKMLKALTECFIQHLEERELTYVLSEYSYTHTFEDITDEQ